MDWSFLRFSVMLAIVATLSVHSASSNFPNVSASFNPSRSSFRRQNPCFTPTNFLKRWPSLKASDGSLNSLLPSSVMFKPLTPSVASTQASNFLPHSTYIIVAERRVGKTLSTFHQETRKLSQSLCYVIFSYRSIFPQQGFPKEHQVIFSHNSR